MNAPSEVTFELSDNLLKSTLRKFLLLNYLPVHVLLVLGPLAIAL